MGEKRTFPAYSLGGRKKMKDMEEESMNLELRKSLGSGLVGWKTACREG